MSTDHPRRGGSQARCSPPRASARKDQIAVFRFLICTGARQNPMTSGTNPRTQKRQLLPLRSSRGGSQERCSPPRASARKDQIDIFRSLICTGARQNPVTRATNPGTQKRRFTPTVFVLVGVEAGRAAHPLAPLPEGEKIVILLTLVNTCVKILLTRVKTCVNILPTLVNNCFKMLVCA